MFQDETFDIARSGRRVHLLRRPGHLEFSSQATESSETRRDKGGRRRASILLARAPIEERLLTPLFLHRPSRFISRHARTIPQHNGKAMLRVWSHTRPLAARRRALSTARGTCDNGEGRLAMQPPPTWRTGLHLTWATNTCCPEEDTHHAHRERRYANASVNANSNANASANANTNTNATVLSPLLLPLVRLTIP